MIKLSLAQCINATNEGTFTSEKLNLTHPLSIEDMQFLSEYLRVTPIKVIELSLEITQENSYGLRELSDVISGKAQLSQLKFEVSAVHFNYQYKNIPELQFLGFIDDRRLKKVNNRVLDAMSDMVSNKPNLRKLTLNLDLIKTPASTGRAKQFAKNIAKSPLKYLDIDLLFEKGSKLPLIKTREPNMTLKHVTLNHTTYGSDSLHYLQHTKAVQELIIKDMQFSSSDLDALDVILKSNSQLHHLALNTTNLGQIDSRIIFERLKACPNINRLELSDNNFSRLNVDELCDYISSPSCPLILLDLTRNAYMDKEMGKIALALATNTKLEQLIIDNNYIEDGGIQAIISLLKNNPIITSLSMSDNCRVCPSDETIEMLCSLIRDPYCHLQELNFNQFTSFHQLEMLTNAILQNRSIRHVSFNYSEAGSSAFVLKVKTLLHLQGLNFELHDSNSEHESDDAYISCDEDSVISAEKSTITECSTSSCSSDESRTIYSFFPTAVCGTSEEYRHQDLSM